MAENKIDLEEITSVSAKERFNKLDGERTTVLDRARACSKLTIPSILPDDGHDEDTALLTPYQALGARLVNNLSSKLLLTLLPPNTSFFRLLMDEGKQAEIAQQDSKVLAQIEAKLIAFEQAIQKQIEKEALRVPIFESLRALIVTGNSLEVKTDTGMKVYRLDNYVVQRDFEGNLLEVVTREIVSKESLPQNIVAQMEEKLSDDGDIYIYTRAVKKAGKWVEYQYVNDVLVMDSDTVYASTLKLPYIVLRWSAVNGENYGRGIVEQYLGDFRSLEGLYQLLMEASAVMARVIFGKRPGAVLDIEELNSAENGEVIYGDLEQDLTTLRVEKGSDLQIPLNMVQEIIRRLEQAFLVASSVARESERTTATEIRYMASDLEQALGGVYSVLSLELQRPLANLLIAQSGLNMKEVGVEPIIVTGIEALGRNAELDKLRQFLALLGEMGSPEQVLPRMNIGNIIDAMGNALELDTTPFIKSDEQIAQEQQAQQEQMLMQQGAQGLVQGAVNSATQPPQG